MPDAFERRPLGATGSPDSRLQQAVDSITVLRTHGPLATKRVTFNRASGQYHFGDYSNARMFSISERPVSGIHDLARQLEEIGRDQQNFIVRGRPAEGIDRQNALRRLHPRKDKVTGKIDPATLEPADRHWLLLDLDSIPCPDHIDPIHEPDALVEHVVGLLPPEFSEVTCWWCFTSGHGIKPGIRLRLAFWSSRKLGTEQLKAWLGETVDGKKRWPVDTSIFVPSQPNYIAKPLFEFAHDPVPHRSGVWDGDTDEFTPPNIDLTKPVVRGPTAHGTPGMGYQGYRALIGDHSGMGFYEPIKRAVATYLRRHGSSVDTTWLRDDLESVIRERQGIRTNEYIEHRTRDLVSLIEHIRNLQAEDEARQRKISNVPFPVPRGAVPGVEPYWITNPRPVGEIREELGRILRLDGNIAVKVTPGSGKSTTESKVALEPQRSPHFLLHPRA